jgi:D-tyrosyl-tRNA(Tyr) deacylase
MINRRELIGKFGSAALVAGAAVVLNKPALADDDGYKERREEDREYLHVFEEFDECEGKVIKITEHVRLHVKHFRRDDGYHKYECHEYWYSLVGSTHKKRAVLGRRPVHVQGASLTTDGGSHERRFRCAEFRSWARRHATKLLPESRS